MKIKRIRDFPLAIKLWAVFTCIIIPCIVLLSVAFKFVLDYTQDETIYSSIQKARQLLKENETQGSSGGAPALSRRITTPSSRFTISASSTGRSGI